jgi:hypothetical protein
MTQPATPLPLSPETTPAERRDQIEQRAAAREQPTTLAGWRELLGPLPPPEEGEDSIDTFEETLNSIRKRSIGVPSL